MKIYKSPEVRAGDDSTLQCTAGNAQVMGEDQEMGLS